MPSLRTERQARATSPSPSKGELDACAEELRDRGIELEREVDWPQGGRSIYVRDPAGNSVELVEGDLWPR